MSHATDGVWVLDLDDGLLRAATDPGWLDASEVARAERLRDPAASRRYVTAHAALRLLLAEASGTAPDAVLLLRAPCVACGEPHGRPFAPNAPGFSLSRSGRFAALAIAGAQDARVGVDLEVGGPRVSLEPLRADILAPGETSHDLLRTWVRKEALLKASGEGLTRRMTTIRADDPAVRDLDTADLGLIEGGAGTAGGTDRVGDPVDLVAAVVGVAAPVALFTGASRASTRVRQPMPLAPSRESDA